MDLPQSTLPAQTGVPRTEPAERDKWVLFDGDNTLWHIEVLYDRARQALVRHIERAGGRPDEVEAFQRLEDKRLFAELGYSSTRFAQSFENTLRRFVTIASNLELQNARHLALSVFEQTAEIDSDVPEVLGWASAVSSVTVHDSAPSVTKRTPVASAPASVSARIT